MNSMKLAFAFATQNNAVHNLCLVIGVHALHFCPGSTYLHWENYICENSTGFATNATAMATPAAPAAPAPTTPADPAPPTSVDVAAAVATTVTTALAAAPAPTPPPSV